MKKKKWLFAILVVVVLGFCIFQFMERPQWKQSDIKKLEITVLPSPPEKKELDQEEDIKLVMEVLESAKGLWVPHRDVKGWEMLVNMYDENNILQKQVSFLNSFMQIDDKWYYVGRKPMNTLKEIYNAKEF